MNVKRWTVCLFRHDWAKVRYPGGGDGDEDTGYFIRCVRCGHENHDVGGTSATGAPLGM
jgi:hypothetical protein